MSKSTQECEFDRWSDAFDRAWEDPGSITEMECPSCGSRSLNLLYVVEADGAVDGMYAFWCYQCLRGFPPGFGPIPEGARSVRRGEESVPNYELVVDE